MFHQTKGVRYTAILDRLKASFPQGQKATINGLPMIEIPAKIYWAFLLQSASDHR